MQFIIYTLTSLIITLGLFIGLLLTIISPEELKPGKFYFKVTKHITFYLIIFFSLIFFKQNTVHILITLTILVFYFLEMKLKGILSYLLLSVIFYLSTQNQSQFLIISSLLLIYTIFISINLRNKYIKKNNLQIIKLLILNYIWFFISTLVLYYAFYPFLTLN